MADLLRQIINMSLTAGAVILVVLLARALLRRAPRWCSYALWSVVLFRLLCPVSISSALSMLNLAGQHRFRTYHHGGLRRRHPAVRADGAAAG